MLTATRCANCPTSYLSAGGVLSVEREECAVVFDTCESMYQYYQRYLRSNPIGICGRWTKSCISIRLVVDVPVGTVTPGVTVNPPVPL